MGKVKKAFSVFEVISKDHKRPLREFGFSFNDLFYCLDQAKRQRDAHLGQYGPECAAVNLYNDLLKYLLENAYFYSQLERYFHKLNSFGEKGLMKQVIDRIEKEKLAKTPMEVGNLRNLKSQLKRRSERDR